MIVVDAFGWAWSRALGACPAPPQVACPTPPWCLAPPPCLPCTSLVLGLLLVVAWSCLSNHATKLLVVGCCVVVIIPPDAQLMSRVICVGVTSSDCSQWCVNWVLWCWPAVEVDWVFLSVNLGRPNPSTVTYIYLPMFSGVLTPRACIWWMSYLLTCLAARPVWSLADILAGD
jgi:hypothetical protein